MKGLKNAFSVIIPMALYMLVEYLVSFFCVFFFAYRQINSNNGGIVPGGTARESMIMQAYTYLGDHVLMVSAISAAICIVIFYFSVNRLWLKKAYRYVPDGSMVRPYVLTVILSVGFTLAANLFVNAVGMFSYAQDYAEISRQMYSEPIYMQILAIVLLVPMAEELMFRGLIYERSCRFMNEKMAVIMTSLLFGFYHGNWIQMVYAFFFSLLMFFVYDKCGSFKAALLFHIVSNASAICLNQLTLLTTMQFSIGIVVTAVIGIAAFMIMRREDYCERVPLDIYNDQLWQDSTDMHDQEVDENGLEDDERQTYSEDDEM